MSNNNFFGVQFYPTPSELAIKMFEKIEWDNVKNILEPSAWKGDIIEAFNENKYSYVRTNRPNWFWFEIDLNLRDILKHKCDLLWFDFLGFQDSFIEFDAIIMNPPFKNWVDHILKAWDILSTGQVVCILNAETIKNPNSEKRKRLVDLIEEHWEVEYIESAFEEAERKTSVEVAVVYLKKNEDKYANIFAGFKDNLHSDYESLFSEVQDNEIVKKGDTETLLAYNRIIKKQVVETAISKAKLGHYLKNFWERLDNTYLDEKAGLSAEAFKESIIDGTKAVNRSCWNSFFNTNDQIRSRMTSRVYDDFIKKYSQSDMDFTQDNINYVIGAIMASSWEIHKQNMEELFDEFIRYADDTQREARKTNYGWKIGKKVILPYMCELGYYWGVKVRYDKLRKISDIEKVLCTLGATNFDNIYSAGNLDKLPWDLETNTWYSYDLFKVKFFKKGTMHLVFHDQELVNKFNFEVASSKMWIHN